MKEIYIAELYFQTPRIESNMMFNVVKALKAGCTDLSMLCNINNYVSIHKVDTWELLLK